MSIGINDSAKYQWAKSFTELAIQNDLFIRCEDPAETAKEIAIFFDTIVRSIGSTAEQPK